MLKTRLLTAAVLLPLVVAGILLLPTVYIGLLLGIVLAIGSWEWGCLTRLTAQWGRVLFALVSAVLMCVGYVCLQAGWIVAVLCVALLWWLVAFFMLPRFPRVWDLSVANLLLSLALGLLLVFTTFVALVDLHRGIDGPGLMLWFFVIVWAADTGAYFAGRYLGRDKLAPSVSPGKTRQGAYGGIGLAVLVALLGALWFGFAGWQLVALIVLGGVTAIVSIVGDLTLSMFKRQAGVKDAGNLFPGHGGVLDRLDSMLAAAPVFVLGLLVVQMIPVH